MNLENFMKFPKKTKLHEKFKLLDYRGFELLEKGKSILPLGQLPLIN